MGPALASLKLAPSEASAVGLAKIGNAELAYFNKQMLIHELIRGSLDETLAVEGIVGVFQSGFRCDTVGWRCDLLILKLLEK